MNEYFADMWPPEPAHMGLLQVGAALVGALFVVQGIRKLNNYITGEKRAQAMLRKDQIKELMSEELTDMLLEMQVDGKLSAREVNELHWKFAKQFGFWDMCPRQLVQEPNHQAMHEIAVAATKEALQQTKPDFLTTQLATLKQAS